MGYPQVVRVRAKVTGCDPRTTSARRTMACSSSMVDDPGIEPRDAGNHDAVEILGGWCVGQVAALESLADRHAIERLPARFGLEFDSTALIERELLRGLVVGDLPEDIVAACVDAFDVDRGVAEHHVMARDRHDDLAVILVTAVHFLHVLHRPL